MVAPQNRTARRWTKGKPLRWVAGHSPATRANFALLEAARPPGASHRYDVPIARVRPLAGFLRGYVGSSAKAAALTGLPLGTFTHALYAQRAKGVDPHTAECIVAAVLAIRGRVNPDAPHLVRLPLATERAMAEDARRARLAADKKRWRARQKEEAS